MDLDYWNLFYFLVMLLIQLVNHDNPNQDENLFDDHLRVYNERLYLFESVEKKGT